MSDTSLNWALWQVTRKRGDKRALLNIPHFTLHDFRRTGSTLLQFWSNYVDGLPQGKVIPLRAKGSKHA